MRLWHGCIACLVNLPGEESVFYSKSGSVRSKELSPILSNLLIQDSHWPDRLDWMGELSAAPDADVKLLHGIAGGDEVAFNEFYQRYSGLIYNYLARLMREPVEAEDLMQEAFVAVWKGAGSFRGQAKVKTWLLQIAHNKAVSWLRKK